MNLYRLTPFLAFFAFASATTNAPPARAEGHSPDGAVTAELLTGWRNADDGHVAALSLSLAPGWKTYWRAPGDAGIPPRFDWTGSDNLAGVTPVWPIPEIYDQNGMRAIGYQKQVILPLQVDAGDASREIQVQGRVELGICRDICVPVTVDVAAVLPVDGARDGRIIAALISTPASAQEAQVGAVRCYTSPAQYGQALRAEIDMPRLSGDEAVVVEASDPAIWIGQPESWWEGDSLIAEADLAHVEQRGFSVDLSGLRITVIGGGKAVDIQGCDTP